MAYIHNADLMQNDKILILFNLLLFSVLFSCSVPHQRLCLDSAVSCTK